MPATPLIDTHAHLCDPRFDDDRDAVLERARAAGVATVIAVGETLDDARRNLELADRHPEFRPAAGLYPTHLDLDAAATRAAGWCFAASRTAWTATRSATVTSCSRPAA